MVTYASRVVRSAILVGFPEAAKDAGLDPGEILHRVGIDMSYLEDPDRLISLDAYLDGLALSAVQSGYFDFGVRAAITQGIPDLGSVTLLMREAETVGEAVGYYASHLKLHTDGVLIQLDRRSDPLITVEVASSSGDQSMQASQFWIAGVIQTIRWLVGHDFNPEMVSFPHSRPYSMPVAQRFFRCPVSYNQGVAGIVLSKEDLARPVVTSQPFLRKQALKHLEALMASPNTFLMRVERLIRELLPEGQCTSDVVARHMKMDRRTLNRRLEKEGEGFSSVLQRIRTEVASKGIANPCRSLTELADMLGFESLSSFSRWFQRSFGCTATQWRSSSELGALGPSSPFERSRASREADPHRESQLSAL